MKAICLICDEQINANYLEDGQIIYCPNCDSPLRYSECENEFEIL